MTLSIGVVGYSTDDFDQKEALKYITEGLTQILRRYKKYYNDIEIVSGYTNYGIPSLTYRIADEIGIKTVGYACRKALEMDVYPVDEYHIVGDDWGDESEEFLNRINTLLRVGGGKQANSEAKNFRRKWSEDPLRIIEFDLERNE